MFTIKDKLKFNINPELEGKTALVTGAGGTIGSGIVEALVKQNVNVIAIDISEYAIYRLQERFDVKCIVGDVSDAIIVRMLFDTYDIDYVFHCAAYKHVDLLEDDISAVSAIKNNIMSTHVLLEYSVDQFVFISSDKAIKAESVLGESKIVAEDTVRNQCKGPYKIIRFGNVYNSSGSFVETMNRQIKNNQPITITDERMKRYFMTLNDAVSLINEVVAFEDSGTYLLDMGNEISIMDLVPEGYPIKIIGMRPGEKLSEDLIEDGEILMESPNEKIKCIITTTL